MHMYSLRAEKKAFTVNSQNMKQLTFILEIKLKKEQVWGKYDYFFS